MEEWSIQLEGEEKDLRFLSEILRSPHLSVSEEKGAFILRSSSFNPDPALNDVHKLSTSLVEVLNGAAKVYNRTFQGATVKAVVRIREDGKTERHVRLTALPRQFEFTAFPRRDDLIECWFSIGQQNESVARALTLYGSLEHNWRNLYMVLEVMEDDVGGEESLSEKGWVSAKEISRFKHTANSFRAIGREARHATVAFQPPKGPMSLREAERLIGTLLMRWLESKE